MVGIRAAALLALALLASGPCSAQSYPSKPIRLIVPFAAGGPIDLMARLIGQWSSSAGQVVVVVRSEVGLIGAFEHRVHL
jgi:tripartite-type tricarboxylate transporter receptor subunit TctC